MYSILSNPKFSALDSNGDPLAGGKLYTYTAGTTTPKASYTDSTLGTPNANPVILNSRGEADVWLGSGPYKLILKDSDDVTIWTLDQVGWTATATTPGMVEFATDAETQTGTATDKAITPANLQACTATETRRGVVELATNAETQTGTDTARAITPANLQACTATETRKGVAELSTSAEAVAGTDDATIVTPLKVRNAFNATGTAPVYACRAWVEFNGTGTVAIRGAGNVTSITDNGNGDYTVNFTTALEDINYAALVTAGGTNGIITGIVSDQTAARTTTALRVRSLDTSFAAVDAAHIAVAIFR